MSAAGWGTGAERLYPRFASRQMADRRRGPEVGSEHSFTASSISFTERLFINSFHAGDSGCEVSSARGGERLELGAGPRTQRRAKCI